jgi:ribosomal protein S18 acetylase RimI-like enzyme
MKIGFRKADTADAALLVKIYDAAFYHDYLRYGECPAYGKTTEMMERSITAYPKFVILLDGEPVGCVSCRQTGAGEYEIGCLCVVPEHQGKGIGTQAMRFITSYYEDGAKFTLITPLDKTENVTFYTEKCGFTIQSAEMDGNVEVARFVLER